MKLWPVFSITGSPLCSFNPRRKQTGGFDVENHFGFRIAAQHVLCEKHQLAVRIDDVAVFGNHAQAVGIAVKCQADFGIAVFEFDNEVLQVFPVWKGRGGD